MKTQLSRNMNELCLGTPWRVMRAEAHDFPEGMLLFEVVIGDIIYKETFISISPLTNSGLHVVKNHPDGNIVSMGLTMEGALHNAISRGLVIAAKGGVML